MISMRVFYVFSMKEEFSILYRDSPELLFQILKQIYYMRECDVNYAFQLFHQLTEPIQKEKIDRQLFIKLHKKMPYSKNDNQHIINDLYKDEISILIVKKSYILINSNHNHSSFFAYLAEKNHNYFICDFEYSDYFWLSKLKTLAKNEKIIVE